MRRLLVVVTVAAVGFTACSGSGGSEGTRRPGADGPGSTVPARRASYAGAPCPMPVPAGLGVKVDCGYLSVPEDRAVPRSRTIRLAVMRLHSTSPDPRPDPVVELGGGPGFPSLEKVASLAKSKILQTRDLVVWDHRGIGYSTPNLQCREVEQAVVGMFETVDPPEVEGRRITDATRRCYRRLEAQGVDLDGYDTIENAADLADLRVALGIREWNLHAGSYGTALGIQALRAHPQGLRSVLLDSVLAPDSTTGSAVARGRSALRAFDALYDACAEQPACHARYGDLHAVVEKAAASLTADPERFTIPDPLHPGGRVTVAVTGDDLWAGLFNAMYSPTLIAAIPGVMQKIASGDRSIIGPLVEQSLPLALGSTWGMTNSVNCADRGRLVDAVALRPFEDAHPELGAMLQVNAMENVCPFWKVKRVPASFNTLPRPNGVPVIVAAGAFDPVTPPADSRRVAEALHAPFLLFPDAGHGAIGASECSTRIWFAFMDRPSVRPDTTCMAALKPIPLG